MRRIRHVLLAALLCFGVAIALQAGVFAAIAPGITRAVPGPRTEALAALRRPPAPAPGPAPVRYVALGDSYSSGVGAGSPLAGSSGCDRSTKAYPALWAEAHDPAGFDFAACSGARIGDVHDSQLAALDARTTLVSITVGGNDEGFTSIMTDCNLRGTSRCVSEVHRAADDARINLAGNLAPLYAQIRSLAPHAKVVVVGYPHFYDLHHDCLGLSSRSRQAIDDGVDVLDAVLRAAAAKAGFGFADVRDAFAGHEICDDSPWLHSVSLFHLTESYHPTAHGQDAFYRAFAAAAD